MTQDYVRPDPDRLLSQVQAEERGQTRGKLKIFLGYAAGVGKTYAMLDAARQRQAQGVDVVVGYVETHGRAETEALVHGLAVIPRVQVAYRGMSLSEMDVDALLARKPQLALIDELAHNNAHGSRHTKRYLDVEECLAHGMDVYTTLNIQHIESLNDVVAQITGVRVRETVPDRILDEADELELVDLPPAELTQRLAEGKIYVPEQATRAIQAFFRHGNLAALREMAMRRAADRVDDQMRSYMDSRSIPGPWPAVERVLVCISPSMLGERLVRVACRLAARREAEWFAVYVETPAHARLTEAERDRVAQTLRLAEDLGARSVSLLGTSPAETIIRFAQSHNVTVIIAGKPLRPRWVELLRGSFVDQLIREGGAIDVYVVSSSTENAERQASARPRRTPWRGYLVSLGLVAVISVLGRIISPFIAPTNLVMGYLLAVVVSALSWGRGPAILTALLSVMAFDFFLVPPQLTLAISDTQYLLTFAGLTAVGLAISTLAARARDQARVAQHQQAQTAALYAFSRDLAAANSIEAVLDAIITHAGETFTREVAVLLPDKEALVARCTSPGLTLSPSELAVATWAFKHAQPAGCGTDTLSAASAHYLPLKTPRGVVGILGVKPTPAGTLLTPEQQRLLEVFASQAALAIERAQFEGDARRTRLLEATDKLHTALLNSISHDLRTPLVSITGALSSLRDDDALLSKEAQRGLVQTAWEEADKLNRLVGNLLDMTRLEAGALRLHCEPGDLQDAIGSTLAQLADRLDERTVHVQVPAGFPLVPMDFVIIVRVLANLLDNAIKYSAPGTPIDITVRQVGTEAEVSVADHGIGIPEPEITRVFDKFYRVQRTGSAGGTGLGLSISRGFVEAHGGRIWAANRAEGGTIVTFTLPLKGDGPSRKDATQ